MHHKFLIVGAGPTGIGAALRLMELGERDFLLVEAGDRFGGLAASIRDTQGFTWDLGGHIQFSHYEKFDAYMELALSKDQWLDHQRESWVYLLERFVPYPFQNNLHRLPPSERWECVRGLLDANRRQQGELTRNFDEWIERTFGGGVARLFMRPYNFKVWAHPPEMMDYGWIGDRVAVPALEQVLESVCLDRDNAGWGPNNTFRFPLEGGTGAIWESLGRSLPGTAVSFGQAVVAVDPEARTVRLDSGSEIRFDHLISTMPLTRLAEMTGIAIPEPGLLHSRTHVVGIGLEGQPPPHLTSKCWMYFPESNCPFYRVTVFSNYSARNTPVPGTTWSLMAEVSESRYKRVDSSRVLDDTLRGMRETGLVGPRDKVVSRWHRALEYGYPVPSLGRDAVVEALLGRLEPMGIYSRGRFGAWRYEASNQDHSLMQGVEVVDHILRGKPELTLNRPDLVNGRRNPFPYPEWD